MRIIAKSTLRDFWESGHPGAKAALEEWHRITVLATWTTPNAVKDTYGNASIIVSGDEALKKLNGWKNIRVLNTGDFYREYAGLSDVE